LIIIIIHEHFPKKEPLMQRAT